MHRLLELAFVAVLAMALREQPRASADEVSTGNNARLERLVPPRYNHVYTIYQIDESTASANVLAFGSSVHVGDAYDVVTNRGYIGRVMVDHIELRGCGDARYYDVRARFVGKPPDHVGSEAALALAPARRPPTRAHVLSGPEVPDAPEGKDGLQAIDIDGDGEADLLHYQFHTCGRHAVSDDNAACFETWERTETGWRRIERAEFPICERG